MFHTCCGGGEGGVEGVSFLSITKDEISRM